MHGTNAHSMVVYEMLCGIKASEANQSFRHEGQAKKRDDDGSIRNAHADQGRGKESRRSGDLRELSNSHWR